MQRFLIILVAIASMCSNEAFAAAQPHSMQDAAFFVAGHDKAVAANPPGLTFTLRIKDGRTTFHAGERIPIELAFENHSNTAYNALSYSAYRGIVGKIDQFVTDRPDDAVDPEEDTQDLREGIATTGMWSLLPVPAVSKNFEINLNPWLAPDRPGVYRLYDTTYRVTTGHSAFSLMTDPGTKPLTSNIVTITILPHDPRQESKTIKEAFDKLSTPRSSEGYSTLTYMRTLPAGIALLQAFEDSPAWPRWVVLEQVRAVIDSPYKSELFEILKKHFKDPHIGITSEAVYAYSILGAYTRHYANAEEAQKAHNEDQWKYCTEAYALLASTVEKKRGRARAVSLEVLADWSSLPEREAYYQELLTCFDLLPSDKQYELLTLANTISFDPALAPALVRIIKNKANVDDSVFRKVKDIALERLVDYNPTQARQIILNEIGKKWPNVDAPPLMLLPGEKPNLDETLLRNFQAACEEKADLPTHSSLIGKFGTQAISKPVEQFIKQNWKTIIAADAKSQSRYDESLAPLFSFLYRTDPAYAEELYPAAADTLKYSFSAMAQVSLSPVLKKAIVAGLNDADPDTVGDAAKALAEYGEPADEAYLWTAFKQYQEKGDKYQDHISGIVWALANAKSWMLTDDEFAILVKAVPEVDGDYAKANDVHNIDVSAWKVDNYQLDSKAELENKLIQFPTGAKFKIKASENMWEEKRSAELKTFLQAHSMSIADTRTD